MTMQSTAHSRGGGLDERHLSPGHLCTLVGLLLLAFAVRLTHLDAQSIWVDEGISLHLATSTLAEIVANRASNIHPPLYFFLLKAWIALAGTSVFSARFLSAMASLLQVAAVFAVARRWLGQPTAEVAAGLTALSPVSVIYAQEIRVYALLPLVYLADLGITREVIRKPVAPSPDGRYGNLHGRYGNLPYEWLLLGVVETVGLYLNYTVLALVIYTSGWALLTFWRQHRWADLRRWTLTQLLVGLACLPWLAAVLAHWPAVQARIQLGSGVTESASVDYLANLIWAFHLTGLPNAVGRPPIGLLADIVFALLVAVVILRLCQPARRPTMTRLVAQWLIPLGSALLVWAVRPFSHPRYVTLFVPGLILLSATAIYPHRTGLRPGTRDVRWAVRCLPSVILAICLGAISLLALQAYLFDPAFAKDDMYGVARYLETEARPDDLILIPEGDWSLTFLYQGEAPMEMPGRSDEEIWANLARWTASHRKVFMISHRHGIARDSRRVLSFALEKAGVEIGHRQFDDLSVHTYQLSEPVEPPSLAPLKARFGPLVLTQAWAEVQAPADTALTLALRWRLSAATSGEENGEGPQRYGVTLRLLDLDGWALAVRDDLLLDEQTHPTDRWAAGQETTTYHILRIPLGTPPLTYTVTAGVYAHSEDSLRSLDLLDASGAPQGQHLDLAEVRLTGPAGLSSRAYGSPLLADEGLQLVGAGLDRSSLSPGQSLFVVLHWRAARSPLPDLRPRLALVQGGQELASAADAPALGRYPTQRWQAGEMVVEHRRLVVPPTGDEGPADVILTLGDQRVILGQIEITAGEHIFTPPPISHALDVRFGQVARLMGYEMEPHPLISGEPITLTLLWQALEQTPDVNYTVFAHLLSAEGRLVGQHDGQPVGGTRPTIGWVPGEIITDEHIITFREPYSGPAIIEVGLYDPGTMERVPTAEGDTFALLPAHLDIREP